MYIKSESFDKLEKLINFLQKNNDYYKEVLRKKKLTTLAKSFFEIPFLTREEIYVYGLSGNKTLLSENLKIGYIFSTGGTTGKSKYIAYSYNEFKLVCDYLSKCYKEINEKDTVANLFMAGNMWASFLFTNRALEKLKCTILPISGTTKTELIKEYINHFKPNCLIGIPTQIKQVLSLQVNFVEKIYYGGESFLEEDIDFLRNIGCKIIRSGGYASVDADIIAYQCSHLKTNQHYIFTDHQIVEIIDIDTLQNIWEKNKVGEVVVTNLDRFLNPVIRYRTGDLGKWINTDCQCGEFAIELMGRYDDWIRLASYDFYYHDFAKAFYPYNISLKINKKQNLITVLVEKEQFPQQQTIDFDQVTEKLKQTNWQLKEALEENLIKIEICFVKNLPRTNKKINVIYYE